MPSVRPRGFPACAAALCLLVHAAWAEPRAGAAPPTPAPPAGGAVKVGGIPDEPDDQALFAKIAEFCWDGFLALNRKADAGARGVIDPNSTLAVPGESTVWMSWRSIDDVFRPNLAAPPAWDAPAPAAPPHLALSRLGKLSLSDISQPGADVKLFIGPVVAQNRWYARYDIRYNRDAYDHIRDNKLYDWHYLPGKHETPDEFPPGSVVVKASWRVIDESLQADRDFKAHCFWTQADLADPASPSTTKPAVMGLVGLHVVFKTPKRPQWIWSSFEHVDNVPGPQGVEPKRRYSFNYGVVGQGISVPVANKDANPPPGKPPEIPSVAKAFVQEGQPSLHPTQVTRLQPIHPDAIALNTRYQDRLGSSIWRFYQLVVTQFPLRPTDTGGDIPGAPYPAGEGTAPDKPGGLPLVSVANTTMETYFQTQTSCMKCHAGARNYGVAFLFSLGRSLPDRPPRPFAPALAGIGNGVDPGEQANRVRSQIGALDGLVLSDVALKVTPPPPTGATPGPQPNRAGAPALPVPDADPAPEPAPAPAREEIPKAVRDIFIIAVKKWTAKNSCPPEIAKKHGASFGWAAWDQPWQYWDELAKASFSGSTGSIPLPLLNPKAQTVRAMPLIQALRGGSVQETRGQQMPLGGPPLEEAQIQAIENYIAGKMNKPAH